jgi:hypothetical protein
MWEYLVVRIKTAKLNEAEQILNDWGEEGWELVSVSWHFVWSIAYLKRQKDEAALKQPKDRSAAAARAPV